MDADPRHVIVLDGLWRFAIDQDPEYHRGYDYSRATSLRHWESVPVPGCWNRYAERYDLYEGVAWFVREFHLPHLPPDAVATLHFGGVNYRCDVFLNGQRLGGHEGGYTAFALDASGALNVGANRLAVRVDNRHLRMRLPAVLGWYNYGGIHREVRLVVTAEAQIATITVAATPRGAGAEGTVRVAAAANHRALTCRVTLRDPQDEVVWEGEAAGAGAWLLPFALAQAQPWSPDAPAALYRCGVELADGERALDRHTVSFGVRRLEVSGRRILHNAEPLHLRGICYLCDHPETGVTCDPEAVRQDLDALEALSVNCLRSHFPVPDLFLDECDRRGMMLWLEAPIYCVAPPADQRGSIFADDAVTALALQMLEEMVAQAINHPSVIIWSVGNECNTEHPEAEGFFRACVERVRSLDPTRLVSYAALYGGIGCVADLVDVISINQYWGWYDRVAQDGIGEEQRVTLPIELPQLEQCLAEKSALGRPLLLSEFGADAEPGYRCPDCALWSEDYQAALLARTLEIAARFPAVCGTFPFAFADYRDPSKPITQHWHGLNLKGIVSWHREPKLACEPLGEAYQQPRRTP